METVICDIYGRVSTAEQANEGHSIAEQEERLKKYAEAHGWIVHNVYMDGGYSGATLNRPGINEVIRDAKSRKINKLLVYKLDRLSRSQKDTLYLIEDVFLPNLVDFVSMSESLDTSTPFGMAIVGILSVFAQFEREQIKERMMMGKIASVKKGGYGGGRTLPLGIRYDKLNGWSHDEYEAMIVREIFDMYISGLSGYEISKRILQKYGSSGIKMKPHKVIRMIHQPMYIGMQNYQGEIVQLNGLAPLIDKKTFDAAQAEYDRRNKGPAPQGNYPYKNLLGGICYCGKCGRRMSTKTSVSGGKSYTYYICRSDSVRNVSNYGSKEVKCEQKSIRVSKLDQTIIEQIRNLSNDRSLISKIIEPRNDEAKKKKILIKKISEISSQIERLVELYSLGTIDSSIIIKQSSELSEQREILYKELDSIPSFNAEQKIKQINSTLDSFDDVVSSMKSNMELFYIVHSLIKRVDLNDNDVNISWNFE